MTAAELAVIAIAVLLAAVVQATSGFGFGLLAVPVMSLAISTRDAVVVSTLLGIGVSAWQAWRGRAEADRVLVRRMAMGAYAGMPFGLWAFVSFDDHVLRLLLGIAVIIAVALLAMRIDLRHSGAAIDVGAGFLSGVLNTSLSTNGPPLVFALQARHLGPQPFRSTITMVFALSNVAGLTLFVVAGRVHPSGVVAAAVTLPALLTGQVIGFRLRPHLHGDRFRWFVILLLLAAAVTAIISALG